MVGSEPMAASNTIVAALDGTPGALNALAWACHYAALSGASVDAVRVWAPTDHRPDGADDTTRFADAVARWADEHGVGVDLCAREVNGMVVQALVDESHHAGLLVLGSRGHHHGPVAIMGSVSRAVAERAACPVVVVHPHDRVPGVGRSSATTTTFDEPAPATRPG